MKRLVLTARTVHRPRGLRGRQLAPTSVANAGNATSAADQLIQRPAPTATSNSWLRRPHPRRDANCRQQRPFRPLRRPASARIHCQRASRLIPPAAKAMTLGSSVPAARL